MTAPPTGPAWFVAGARLMTLRGEIPVEHITEADQLLTLAGIDAPLKPVRGTLRLAVDLDRHRLPRAATPIRIRADAIEPGVPLRDLLLSPGHRVALAGPDGARILVPAADLANGASILREPEAGGVAYVQILLAAHDIVMANGLAAEAALPAAAPLRAPDPTASPDLSSGHPDAACAPAVFGPQAAALHAALLARAEALGHRRTDDPALTLLLGPDALPPYATEPGRTLYRLPPNTARATLRSRTMIPMEFDPPCGDPRRLGIPVAEIQHDGLPIALNGPALSTGFLPPEAAWRWTDGEARLILLPSPRETTLDLRTHPGWASYWLPPPA